MRQLFIIAACSSIMLISCSKDDNGGNAAYDIAQAVYTLPGDTLFPEGIAYQPRTGHFYTGSVTTGDILKVNVETGEVGVWAAGQPHGRKAATGMKIDSRDRLWVCGGLDNKVQVLAKDGSLIKSYDMAMLFGSGFINDCIMDDTHVYFTDSRVQKIYRIPLGDDMPGAAEQWLSFSNAQIPYTPTGTNANGIEITPDRKYLILVVSTSGKLYRITINDKTITEIPLTAPVTSGDGLYLDVNKLYVSRNATNQIFPVMMNVDYSTGAVGAGFGDNLLFNTTIARAGNYLLTVNGQLNRRTTPPPPVLPFTVSRVAIP